MVLVITLPTGDALGACHLSILTTLSCLTDYYYGCLRSLYSGKVYGNSAGTSPGTGWHRATIVAGTKIGMMLDFNQDDGTATVTAYKDGVKVRVLSTGSLRGPLCPGVWFGRPGQSVEFVSSKHPHS